MILSHEHGVAPALTFCRICGKDINGLVLLGSKCNTIMREVYEATKGAHGSKDGYESYGHNRVPDSEPCDECKALLNGGGCIIIAEDTGEYLRLDKEMVDSLIGRVGCEKDGEMVFIDFDRMRGKIHTIPKAFWYADGENIRLRDPKEWA